MDFFIYCYWEESPYFFVYCSWEKSPDFFVYCYRGELPNFSICSYWGESPDFFIYRLMVCEIHIFVAILVVAIVELTFMTAKGGARIFDYTFFLHLLRRVLPCFCPRYCWGLGGGCAESDPELPPFASDALHQTRWTLLLLLLLQLLLHHLLLLLASRQAILVRSIFVRSAI